MISGLSLSRHVPSRQYEAHRAAAGQVEAQSLGQLQDSTRNSTRAVSRAATVPSACTIISSDKVTNMEARMISGLVKEEAVADER